MQPMLFCQLSFMYFIIMFAEVKCLMHSAANFKFLPLLLHPIVLVIRFSQTGSMVSFVCTRLDCHDNITLIHWIKIIMYCYIHIYICEKCRSQLTKKKLLDYFCITHFPINEKDFLSLSYKNLDIGSYKLVLR